MVVGLGRAGIAASTALLHRFGPGAVAGWDGASHPRLADAVDELQEAGVRTVLGGDGVDVLDDHRARTVVASPGVPDDAPVLVAARRRRLHVVDEAELGWHLDGRPWVGVTGTNGKGTTVRLVEAILRAAGRRPVVGGNMAAAPPLTALPPDGDLVVAELSSFQLARSRRMRCEASVLTSFARDHLDRHGSMARYAEAKRRLFLRRGVAVPAAAVAIDDAGGVGAALAVELRALGASVRTFGSSPAADVRIEAVDWDLAGSTVAVGGRTVRTHLPGPHNAGNVAAALALAGSLGLDVDGAAAAVARVEPPPGRFRRLDLPTPFDVVVDFAKNSAGMAAAMATARRVVDERRSRLVAVVSATPPGDPGDRFAMGVAVGDAADAAVVTVERWAGDDPPGADGRLVAGVRSKLADVAVVDDRRHALAAGLRLARAGDVVVVAGRGAGPLVQVAADGTAAPFDDAAELRALVGTA